MDAIKTGLDAENFLRRWLGMIDANEPSYVFFKFMTDGPFEEWSYPDAEIRDIEHLKMFFEKTWGAFKRNRNVVMRIESQPEEKGRFRATADVDWEATMGTDQEIRRALRYSLVVGNGTSSRDPEGRHPKIFRYKVTRIEG